MQPAHDCSNRNLQDLSDLSIGETTQIDQRNGLLDLAQPFVLCQRFELLAQFGDDFFESSGVEDRRGFGQRAERSSLTTQLLLNPFQFAGLLNSPQ